MLCSFLLYSKVNQLYVYIYPLFFGFPSHLGHHRSLSRVPCAITLIFFKIFYLLFIYYFIFGCVGSSFLCEGFLQLQRAGATLHRGARASHYRGLSCCGAQAQQLWLMGPVAPRHVGSSQTRARTRVPCIGRQTPNHCATREAPITLIFHGYMNSFLQI